MPITAVNESRKPRSNKYNGEISNIINAAALIELAESYRSFKSGAVSTNIDIMEARTSEAGKAAIPQ